MNRTMNIQSKISGAAKKVWEWDKKLAKKIQKKLKLSDHQMLCLAFAKGFVIGAILL